MSTGKKIKIFVDAHCFDTAFQGTQTFVRGLYTQLLLRDDMDIYFGTHNPENIAAAFPNLRMQNILPYKKRRPAILRFYTDIPAILKSNDFDFAHFQYMAPAQVNNCRYVLTMHDVLFNDFKTSFSWQYRNSRNFLFGRSFKKAAIKTTVSAYSASRISNWLNIPGRQIHIIPNGIDGSFGDLSPAVEQQVMEKFKPGNFILYVSRVEPRKNHLLLLDKFLQLELYRQNISLVFIGDCTIQTAALQNKIDLLTPEQKPFFHWFKQVSQQELATFYRRCKLFVYPSKAEGFGIPPLEAAVCKVPVLCSNTTAMKDFGFFQPYTFNPDNEPDFENKLKAMIESGPSDSYLNTVAAAVLNKYSWQKSAASFYNLLTQNNEPWH